MAVAFVLAFVGPPAFAVPAVTTPQIEAKKAQAERAQAALDDMHAELEERIEEYEAITEALTKTRAQIEKTRHDLELTEARLGKLRANLNRRAAGIYKTGKTGVIDVLLETDSFSGFLVRLDLLTRLSRQDAQLVSEVKRLRDEVTAHENALETRHAEQVVLRGKAEAKREEIEAGIDKQKAYLDGLESEVAALMRAEKARQERLAAERARRAAEAARARRGGEPASDPGSLGPGHPEVVDVALRYLGVPYVWGGMSPSGFDCSGLTKYCYAEIGIEIPRTSRSQYRSGKHIASDRLDLLRPGDLVFFGREGDPGRVHHVGIYVGNGDFIHAPQTGERVKVSSLQERIESRGDYVGASRF